MKRIAIVFLILAFCVPLMFADVCSSPNKSAVLVNTTANSQLITGKAATNVYVCSFVLSVGTATNVAIVEGTGSTCATGTAGLTGGATAATGLQLGANATVPMGGGGAIVTRTATKGDNVCIFVSAANQVSGVLTYVIQ